MTIIEILRKHQASDDCIAEVQKLISVRTATRALDSRESERLGMASLKRYLRRDATRRFAEALEPYMREEEEKDSEGKTLQMHYRLTFVRET